MQGEIFLLFFELRPRYGRLGRARPKMLNYHEGRNAWTKGASEDVTGA